LEFKTGNRPRKRGSYVTGAAYSANFQLEATLPLRSKQQTAFAGTGLHRPVLQGKRPLFLQFIISLQYQ